MINIDRVHKKFYLDWNKEQSGNTVTPDQFGILVTSAMYEVYNYYMDDWERTREVTEKIGYWKSPPTDIQVIGGEVTAPADYLHFVDARTAISKVVDECKVIYEVASIELLPSDEYSRKVDCPLEGATPNYPKMEKIGSSDAARPTGYFRIQPSDTQYVRLLYMRKPVVPVWNYQPINDRAVYDPAGSVDVDLPEQCLNELVERMIGQQSITARELAVLQAQQVRQAMDQQPVDQ